MKTTVVLSDEKPEDEPFVFPKDVTQVFFVDDPIYIGWKLVVKVDPRSNLVVYKRRAEISEAPDQETASGSGGSGGGPDPETERTPAGRGKSVAGVNSAESAGVADTGRQLVEVEADDDAGEAVDHGDDYSPIPINAELNEDFSDDEDDGGELPAVTVPEYLQFQITENLPHVLPSELEDIESRRRNGRYRPQYATVLFRLCKVMKMSKGMES